MLNNFCEDSLMSKDLLEFHEKILNNYEIPQSLKKINCPYCKKDMPIIAIRSISIKLNPRNVGDVSIEVFCPYCEKMDVLYFNEDINNIQEFADLLMGKKTLKTEAMLEDLMYKKNYNNALRRKVISHANN